MENTSALLFDDKEGKVYFLAIDGETNGPLSSVDIYESFQSGKCSLMHYVWRKGWKDWKLLGDLPQFAAMVPKKPATQVIEKLQTQLKNNDAPPPAPQQKSVQWFLSVAGSQFGPFSEQELKQTIVAKKLDGRCYVWTQGWPQWKLLSEVSELSHLEVPKTKTRAERRQAPRKPLVARLFVHDDKEMVVAVCRDVSIGGMQVLTDRVPGEVGSRLKLNVSPSSADAKVKGFVAEGEIVRILEDGRGFSFRFTKISADAKKAIEQYIQAS